MTRNCYITAILLAALAGCAPWSQPLPERPVQLPAPRMSPDSVVLEIAFVTVPPDAAEQAAAIWQEVDEQQLPNDLRRRLDENGLRCGLVGSPLPSALRGLIDRGSAAESAEPDLAAVVEDKITARQQRLQSRSGKRHQIAVTDRVQDQLVVLLREDGEVRGEVCEQGQCFFASRTFPQGDGDVRLELTPEIEYGQPRTRIVGQHQQGAWMLDASREHRVFENLRIETDLAPGQTLVLSSTADARGLGRHFFQQQGARGPERRLLLIRLAQTQQDDLFAPQSSLNPIVTPTD